MKIRTGYSFRHAAGTVKDVLTVLRSNEEVYAPISDRASTFGFCSWRKYCGQMGLKPIYGVELAVTPSPNAKKPVSDYWSFFAQNDLSVLNRLVEQATNQFRFEPLLTYDQAMAAIGKGLTVITGHRPQFGEIARAAQEGHALPFFPLSPSTSRGALRGALAADLPLILSNDNRYPKREDVTLYETVCGRNASIQTYPQWILTRDELRANAIRLLGDDEVGRDMVTDAEINLDAAYARCTADLIQGTLLTPEKPETLRDMCLVGAAKLGCDLSDPVYLARLDRELGMIQEKAFENYFYIIADAVQWARGQMLVGPARGSSCGSLVCYFLEITTIDPIRWNLIFERFIDVNRDDLPDIDIDFADTKRELVFEYMREKYGASRIARLGASALYKSKSAINEACAALRIPPWETKSLVDSIVERSSGDARALNTIEDAFTGTTGGRAFFAKYPQVAIATKMEGHPRHYSQHAAGIVVTERPVVDYVAIDSRTGAAMCDKKDAEELNLLKIDALGLTQLSVLQDFLKAIDKPLDFFDSLALDDPAAFEVLNRGDFAGIFQFNGLAMKAVSRLIKFDHIEDIISVTALARPGPLASGGTMEWIDRKNGKTPVSFPHPAFQPYTEGTKGVIIYQEQVMEIGRNIGDLSWGDVTALRKAMSKSLGKEYFDQFGDRFKAGAINKGIPANVLEKVWDDLCAYGSWSFNRSHSVAYGLISYYCCWAKAHYPYEFAAASMTHMKDPDRVMLMLRELDGEGIHFVSIHPELSTDQWTVAQIDGERKLIGPLTGIKGFGPKTVMQVMSAKAMNLPITGKAAKLLANPKTDIDTIWPVRDSVFHHMPDPREKNIYTPATRCADIITNGEEQEVVVFVVVRKIAPRDDNEPASIAKRGYAVKGQPWKLNLRISDDTEEMLAMVGRRDYETLGKQIIDRGGAGKVLYAMKGIIMKDFKMMIVKRAIYIGEML